MRTKTLKSRCPKPGRTSGIHYSDSIIIPTLILTSETKYPEKSKLHQYQQLVQSTQTENDHYTTLTTSQTFNRPARWADTFTIIAYGQSSSPAEAVPNCSPAVNTSISLTSHRHINYFNEHISTCGCGLLCDHLM